MDVRSISQSFDSVLVFVSSKSFLFAYFSPFSELILWCCSSDTWTQACCRSRYRQFVELWLFDLFCIISPKRYFFSRILTFHGCGIIQQQQPYKMLSQHRRMISQLLFISALYKMADGSDHNRGFLNKVRILNAKVEVDLNRRLRRREIQAQLSESSTEETVTTNTLKLCSTFASKRTATTFQHSRIPRTRANPSRPVRFRQSKRTLRGTWV